MQPPKNQLTKACGNSHSQDAVMGIPPLTDRMAKPKLHCTDHHTRFFYWRYPRVQGNSNNLISQGAAAQKRPLHHICKDFPDASSSVAPGAFQFYGTGIWSNRAATARYGWTW